MNEFYQHFNGINYITNNELIIIKNEFHKIYFKTKKWKFYIFSKTKRKFIKDFNNIYILKEKNNLIHINNKLKNNKILLDDINGYSLDDEQRRCVVEEEDNLLVIAGAGSGKSLTIIGKIRYLIESKFIEEKDILCISFTNDSTISLKNSLLKNYKYEVDILTFHKLALKIIKISGSEINIALPDTLEFIINEFYDSIIYNYPIIIKTIIYYFNNNDYNYYSEYNKLLKTKKILKFKKLISQFIKLFKSNVQSEETLLEYLNKSKTNRKDYCFIFNVIIIYFLYSSELKSSQELDFDDMISRSSKIINEHQLDLKYKYIIVDEYQDTSLIRCKLLQEIINISKSKLMVVGDDFQSIYRFSGCNLNIFLNFNEYFNNSKNMYISNTYRNSQELIDIAGNFIMKNKLQMKKKLKSSKHLEKPIKIIYYTNQKEMFKNLLLYLFRINKKEILILGRNNNDINKLLDDDFKKENDFIIFNNIKIRYLTVHKSKGLEENNVIIINLDNNILGFPSKLEDDDIIKYIVNYDNKIPYEEERRLFYVAITRTKNYNYLLVNKNNPSIFIKEIIKDYNEYIEFLSIN